MLKEYERVRKNTKEFRIEANRHETVKKEIAGAPYTRHEAHLSACFAKRCRLNVSVQGYLQEMLQIELELV